VIFTIRKNIKNGGQQMKKFFPVMFIAFALFINCKSPVTGELTELWATAADLKTPESVLYDRTEKVLYVSNINGDPSKKDGNGFISKLSLDGTIITLQWVSGLNAPKGMGIAGGYLYAADIDRIVKIDTAKAEVVKTYPVAGAQFLNDITVGADGSVYVSDMGARAIYILQNDKVSLFLKSEELNRPNGIFFENNVLLVGTDGKIMSIDTASKKVSIYIDGTGGIDGLEGLGNHTYIISDWAGKVQLVSKAEKKVLSDTSAQNINAADIEVIPEARQLFIPTFFDNRVVAYKLK
jgi:DNA-binding beta-propeller fold protein YncE